MFTERGQGLIRWGVALILLSVLSGFAIMMAPEPIMGLATHIQGLMNGLLLIAIGVVWSRFAIGYLGGALIYWGLIIGGFLTFGVQLACTFLEIGGSIFPIVGGAHVGTPFQEAVVTWLVRGAAGATTVAVVIAAWATFKKPAI